MSDPVLELTPPAPFVKVAEPTKEPEFVFPEDFQRQLLSLLYHDPQVLRQYAHLLKHTFWSNKVDLTFASLLIAFARKYPEESIDKSFIFDGVRQLREKKKITDEEMSFYLKAWDEISRPITAPGYLKDKLSGFMRGHAVQETLLQSVDLLKNGKFEEIANRITRVIEETSAIRDGYLTVPFEKLSAIDLLSVPVEEKWLFENSLPQGAVGAFAANSGQGKSGLMLQCGVAVTTGTPWIGDLYKVKEPGAVYSIFTEDDPATVSTRLVSIKKGSFPVISEAAFDEGMKRFFIEFGTGKDTLLMKKNSAGEFSETDAYRRLLRRVKGIPNLKLIILDHLQRFMCGDGNSAAEATFFIKSIERLCLETGASCIIVAHTHKGANSGAGRSSKEHGAALLTQEAIRGSTAITASVRAQWVMVSCNQKDSKELGMPIVPHGKYLIAQLVKKNRGKPEAPFYLERCEGGVLKLFKPVAAGSAELDKIVLKEVMSKIKELTDRGEKVTKRFARDYASKWHGYGETKLGRLITQALDDGNLILLEGKYLKVFRTEF